MSPRVPEGALWAPKVRLGGKEPQPRLLGSLHALTHDMTAPAGGLCPLGESESPGGTASAGVVVGAVVPIISSSKHGTFRDPGTGAS